MMAFHTSMIEPLPHQITAVYDSLLPRQPLRFVLADDPGAGKTIMAGLLIKELVIRGDAKRVLIVTPGVLAEQWQDELFGDYNPDGLLPFSYPKSMGEFVLYDRKPTEEIREVFNDNAGGGYDPLFPFGHGLSYTTFEYSDLQLSSNTLSATTKLTITLSVKNTGSRDGKHSVELYTRDLYASITPSMKRLRAFQKISLKAGESKQVSFTIDKNDLAFVNAQLKTVTEAGEFKIMIGDRKVKFNYVN